MILQETVASFASGSLEAATSLRRDDSALADELDAEPLREPCGVERTCRRTWIEAVVEMGGYEAEPELLLQSGESPEQGGGVSAAGEGDDDALTRAHPQPAQGDGQGAEEGHGGGEGTRTPDTADMSRLL
jgi:hypothetical protein